MLAYNPSETFVIFRYEKIQWTTGSHSSSGGVDGLGGNEALAGVNAGDTITSITVPGSQTPSIIDVTQTSNVENLGVWIFQVDGGEHVMFDLLLLLHLMINELG